MTQGSEDEPAKREKSFDAAWGELLDDAGKGSTSGGSGSERAGPKGTQFGDASELAQKAAGREAPESEAAEQSESEGSKGTLLGTPAKLAAEAREAQARDAMDWMMTVSPEASGFGRVTVPDEEPASLSGEHPIVRDDEPPASSTGDDEAAHEDAAAKADEAAQTADADAKQSEAAQTDEADTKQGVADTKADAADAKTDATDAKESEAAQPDDADAKTDATDAKTDAADAKESEAAQADHADTKKDVADAKTDAADAKKAGTAQADEADEAESGAVQADDAVAKKDAADARKDADAARDAADAKKDAAANKAADSDAREAAQDRDGKPAVRRLDQAVGFGRAANERPASAPAKGTGRTIAIVAALALLGVGAFAILQSSGDSPAKPSTQAQASTARPADATPPDDTPPPRTTPPRTKPDDEPPAPDEAPPEPTDPVEEPPDDPPPDAPPPDDEPTQPASGDIREPPPGTPAENAAAFRKLPVSPSDRAPVGGVGSNGIHLDFITMGASYGHGRCQGEARKFSLSAGDRPSVCVRVVHPREKEELVLLWEKKGGATRRGKLIIPNTHAYRTRAYLVLRREYVGDWTVRVQSADGTELAAYDFTVGP